jgi:hypothetical protein
MTDALEKVIAAINQADVSKQEKNESKSLLRKLLSSKAVERRSPLTFEAGRVSLQLNSALTEVRNLNTTRPSQGGLRQSVYVLV